MLLSVREIEKRFGGEQVFSDISFTLDEGHKVALVGRNGAGKSTLVKIIAGLEEQDSGEVKVTNDRKIAYLPQEVVAENSKTGVDYIQDGTNVQPHQFFPFWKGRGVAASCNPKDVRNERRAANKNITNTVFIRTI